MSISDDKLLELNKELEFFNKAKNNLRIAESIYLKVFKLTPEIYTFKDWKYLYTCILNINKCYNIQYTLGKLSIYTK